MSKTIVRLKPGQEATRQFILYVQIYPVNMLYHKPPLFLPAVRISIRKAGELKWCTALDDETWSYTGSKHEQKLLGSGN